MSFGNLYKSYNEDILEEDLLPASLIKTEEDKEKHEKNIGKRLALFDEVKQCAEIIGCDKENIFFSEKGNDSYYYYKFPSFVVINPMDAKVLKENDFIADTLNKQISVRDEIFNKAIKEGNIGQFFANADSRIHILGLEKLYWDIPDEEKYDWFIQIYTSVDYGFSRISTQIVKDAFSKRTEETKEKMKLHLDYKSSEDELIIYRGQQEHSTPIEKAMSWTLNPYVASRFAAFFTGEGEVYKAKVKKENVIDYLTNRNEDEILVLPSDIYDMENMQMIKTSEEIVRIAQNGGIQLYQHYLGQFDKDLFFKPESIHGMKHMKRVLLHVISLARELDLDDFDTRILCLSALYHDIGRTNDWEDPTHGDDGWVKVEAFDLLIKTTDYYQDEEIDDLDKQIVEFIIRNHCLNDYIVWENLKNLDGRDKERIEYLTKVFKDADNLDRVRLGDLDVSYLRLDESKRRVNFAFGLLRDVE